VGSEVGDGLRGGLRRLLCLVVNGKGYSGGRWLCGWWLTSFGRLTGAGGKGLG
jgi:hypothetical protein